MPTAIQGDAVVIVTDVTPFYGQAGGQVVEVALPAGFAEVLSRHRTVMAVEAAAYHRPRLERHPECAVGLDGAALAERRCAKDRYESGRVAVSETDRGCRRRR